MKKNHVISMFFNIKDQMAFRIFTEQSTKREHEGKCFYPDKLNDRC